MTYVFASPGATYLERIGALAYSVGLLEWTLLGDLPALRAELPSAISLETLATQTTGRIASLIERHAGTVEDGDVAHFLEVGVAVLREAASLRNNVLHARPATIDGEQRLYRWTLREDEQFPVDDDHLDRAVERVGELLHVLDAARVNP